MKAAVVTAPNATPEYGEFSEPQVDDGYELVELVAAGLHPIVRSLAAGRHYGSTQSWPLVPGVDVVALTTAGDFIFTGFVRPPHGTFAERMAVPKTMRISLPPGADPVKVAGGLNPGLASWLPLKARVREIGSLATVLVLGATGMAGYLAVQHARLLGANRVVGVGAIRRVLRTLRRLGLLPLPLAAIARPTPQQSSTLSAIRRRASCSTFCGRRQPRLPSLRSHAAGSKKTPPTLPTCKSAQRRAQRQPCRRRSYEAAAFASPAAERVLRKLPTSWPKSPSTCILSPIVASTSRPKRCRSRRSRKLGPHRQRAPTGLSSSLKPWPK
jgi:hypothetical protein